MYQCNVKIVRPIIIKYIFIDINAVIIIVGKNYVEKCVFSYGDNNFLSTGVLWKIRSSQQVMWRKSFLKLIHSFFIHIPQVLLKNHDFNLQ